LIASILMLIASLFPDIKLDEKDNESGPK